MVIRKGKALVHLIHQWSGNAIEVATVNSVAGGQWQHLMFTCDGSGRAAGVAIYLNGVRQALASSARRAHRLVCDRRAAAVRPPSGQRFVPGTDR